MNILFFVRVVDELNAISSHFSTEDLCFQSFQSYDRERGLIRYWGELLIQLFRCRECLEDMRIGNLATVIIADKKFIFMLFLKKSNVDSK